jgi:O-antigen ligase
MLYRAYLSFLCLSIISCAISVSLSQLFLGLCFLTFVFLKGKPDFRSRILLLLIIFYSYELASLFYHFVATGFNHAVLELALKSEMKDILLLSAFFVVQGAREEDKHKITKAFSIFAYIILVSGFISIFSETRLARAISDLYKSSSTWPFQHHYGSLLGINLYLPIGLMNTHLTFGGLIAFVYPYFFFNTYESWKNKKPWTNKLLQMTLLFLISVVFLLNSARSAFVSAVFSVSLGLYILIFIEKEFEKQLLKKILLAFTVFGMFLMVAYFQSTALQKVIKPLFGSEKHTDSGRTFIWDSTFPLILENPMFGIGPGAYPTEIERSRKQKELEHPELAYFYEVTQRGHSHNDYFHLAVIFGIPQVVIYLLLGALIVFGFSSQRMDRKAMFVTLGLSGFFFSGLLQCYFQDDEVLIVFFYLLGYYQMFNKEDSDFL